MRYYFSILFLLFVPFTSVFSQEIVDEYIGTFQYIAISEMERTGIPASIKLAQGLLESSWGQSELSVHAHNHFGIKCGSSWEGSHYYRFDDDYDDEGELMKSCFRVFESDEASYIAHSEFLLNNRRYGFLFDYSSTDHKAWAKGLRKAGYATDPAYPSKLIGIIKKYDLARFDYMASDELLLLAEATHENPTLTEEKQEEIFAEEALAILEEDEEISENSDMNGSTKRETRDRQGNKDTFTELKDRAEAIWNKNLTKRKEGGKSNFNFEQLLEEVKAIGDEILHGDGGGNEETITSTPDMEKYNETSVIIAEQGETLHDISSKNSVSVDNLINYNENLYSADQKLHRGTVIYLEEKQVLYKGDANSHYVQMNESVAAIAQKYGVTARSIRKRNYLDSNEEVKHGEILYLRGIRTSKKPKTRRSHKKQSYLFDKESKA